MTGRNRSRVKVGKVGRHQMIESNHQRPMTKVLKYILQMVQND